MNNNFHIKLHCFLLFFIINIININSSFANNLSVSNVSLEDRDITANTVVVEFDVSWENSWRTKINHDALWITFRLNNPSVIPTNKKLCEISASGLNPSGFSSGSNTNLEINVPADKFGLFLRPEAYGINSAVSSTDVRVVINYSSCGFADDDNASANVFALEMTYIPDGSFYAGDYNGSTAALNQGSADSDPWGISSESAIGMSNPASDGYRYVSGGNVGEDATGTSFSLAAEFPKGYGEFYVMKYEVTEGQWVEFINSLPSANARANRDLTDGAHKNSDLVRYRNTLSCSGSPLVCATSRSQRALNYLTWMDLTAFLDWAALRPITELEYEKMTRGPITAVSGEFAWGSTTITAGTTLSSGTEDGTETVTTTNANVNYNNITWSGGDTGSGVDYTQGLLRSGVFATSSSTRQTAGAGYYGTMELSGSARERVVTIGNATGRAFTGAQGDGVLSTESGYEGNANVLNWPGTNVTVSRGVTGADGSGFKGGGWDDQSSGVRLRISDRNDAAKADTTASENMGGRGARNVD